MVVVMDVSGVHKGDEGYQVFQVLDKRVLSQARLHDGLLKVVEDAFLDIVCIDTGKLVRLWHQGVVHVVQVMDKILGPPIAFSSSHYVLPIIATSPRLELLVAAPNRSPS